MRSAKNVRLPDPLEQPRPWAAAFFTCTLLLMIGVFAASLQAQNKNPLAGDPQAAKLGEFEFRANCAFCHGLCARGGGRGSEFMCAKERHGCADTGWFCSMNT